VQNDRRWKLTDLQSFAVIVAVVCALFLSSMAWGMGNPVVLVVALLLLVTAGLGVFMLGLRHTGRTPVRANAYVITASRPPFDKIIGRCDMQLIIKFEGRPSANVKFRDPSTPVVKWPRPGMVLPVEVSPRTPRQLRVRWEAVPPHHARTASAAGNEAPAAPFYMDYADGAGEREYRQPSDEPRRPAGSPPPSAARPPPPSAAESRSRFAAGSPPRFAAGPPPRFDAGPPRPSASTSPFATAREEAFAAPTAPDADQEPPTLSGLVLDGEIIIDNGVEEIDEAGDTSTAVNQLPTRPVPQPRSADAAEPGAGARLPVPGLHEPGEPQGIGVTMIVSDLDRSLRFYRDLLGFTQVERGSRSAVLDYGAGRLLLRRGDNVSQQDTPVVHLNVAVPNVDAAYKELTAKDVTFLHQPRIANRGDRMDMWAAAFKDPDGHVITLTQWLERA
jgi:catechol 2,3-dioxygenase-like lactoylglutathione lyase family enzyme